MISIIVAKARNGIIGKDNRLIWHLPKDLQYFKKKTAGHAVVMGRKTLESLPFKLPDREHWVLTRDAHYVPPFEGVRIFRSTEEVTAAAEGERTVYVIGGAEIYAQCMDIADELLITEIHQEFEGDVSFPDIDETIFEETERECVEADEVHPWAFDFVRYERRKA